MDQGCRLWDCHAPIFLQVKWLCIPDMNLYLSKTWRNQRELCCVCCKTGNRPPKDNFINSLINKVASSYRYSDHWFTYHKAQNINYVDSISANHNRNECSANACCTSIQANAIVGYFAVGRSPHDPIGFTLGTCSFFLF